MSTSTTPRRSPRGAWTALRLDALSLSPYLGSMLVLAVALVVVGVSSGTVVAMPIIAAVFVSALATYPFAVGEKNDLDTLAGTLPVARPHFIAGRYVLTAVMWAAMIVLAALVATSQAAIRSGVASPVSLSGAWADAVALSALVSAVLVSAELPILYAVGYARGRLLAYVPALALAALIAGAGSLGAVPLAAWLDRATLPPTWICFPVAATILVFSWGLSMRLDERRRARS